TTPTHILCICAGHNLACSPFRAKARWHPLLRNYSKGDLHGTPLRPSSAAEAARYRGSRPPVRCHPGAHRYLNGGRCGWIRALRHDRGSRAHGRDRRRDDREAADDADSTLPRLASWTVSQGAQECRSAVASPPSLGLAASSLSASTAGCSSALSHPHGFARRHSSIQYGSRRRELDCNVVRPRWSRCRIHSRRNGRTSSRRSPQSSIESVISSSPVLTRTE